MTNASNSNPVNLVAFFDNLIDDLFLASDEKVLTDAAEDFGSIRSALGEIDAEIEVAINSLGKDRLAQARAALTDNAKSSSRPQSPTEAYTRLADFIISDQNLKKVTLAARNGQGSSEDDDAFSVISDLCELKEMRQANPVPNFADQPKADYILQNLGITKPEEIDVEAIAWHLGAKVRYGRLSQCEARIVGADDVAIITVDKSVSPQRQRFSICHELGHWIYHRGRMLSCQATDIELPSAQSSNLERAADRFASELLMPSYLFLPIAESLGRPSMRVIQHLSEIFRTSKTATAIRLVELSQRPLCLVNHGKNGRRWFARSQAITGNWIPVNELRSESSAFNMIFGKSAQSIHPKCVDASVWFTRRDASRFQVIEDSFRIASNEILTLLSFKEEKDFIRNSE